MAQEVTRISGVSQNRGLYTGNAVPAPGAQSWDGTNLPGMPPSQTLLTNQVDMRRCLGTPGAVFCLESLQDTRCNFSLLPCTCRNPIKLLYQRTFYFHFKNLRYANNRNNTFLCYEVHRMECGELILLYQGVFRKEDDIHAEECFLYWFHAQLLDVLPPSKEYKITWYVSWSPCGSCAEQVARFLATHRNLSLAVFSSRLYYFWDPHYQYKLHRLIQAGAQIAAMDFPEFKKCWNTFVDNGGKSFRPWKKLKINFRFQDSKLWDILRNPVNLLREDIFNLQFNNGHRVEPVQHRFYQRTTYLCYQLEQYDDQEPLKGCLQNKKGKHAEILFIDEMRSLELGQVRITCYLTWSPCPNCAQKLAAFKKDHPDLVLRVYTSRLYFHWRRKYQEGLCSLWQSGIQVDVMDLPQFTDCWTNFVNPQRPFQPWNQLEKNSTCIQRRLLRIKESWGLQGLLNDFGNLQLGPPLP